MKTGFIAINFKSLLLAFTLLCFQVLFFSSCKKNLSEPEPTPPTPVTPKPGAIKGSIVPGDAAVRVICQPTSGGASIDLINPTGNFKTNDLPAGTYTVSVVPKLGYAAPAAVSITVNGDTASTGMFNLLANGQSKGYFRFTMDAAAWDIAAPAVNCTYVSDVLTITATTTPTVPYWSFKLNLGGISSTGTFNLTPFTASNYMEAKNYLSTTTLLFRTTVLSTNPLVPNGSGTIAVTELNTNSRVITGTFTGVLPQVGLGSQVKRMTNGSFQVNY